jgi:hypothetical protein
MMALIRLVSLLVSIGLPSAWTPLRDRKLALKAISRHVIDSEHCQKYCSRTVSTGQSRLS